MGLTGRRRRVPPLSEQFEGAVREACMRLGMTIRSFDGDVAVLSGRIDGVVALSDVRAACALRPVAEWPVVVGDALAGLARSLEADVDLTDLVAARPLLRARVYTEGAVLADDVVSRPLAEGLVEALVADVRGAVRAVPSAVVAGWAEPVDDLLDLAREQVLLADGLLERRTVDLGGAVVLALQTPSAFAATHVSWLPTYVDVPPAGLLVALPTRHLVLCVAMTSRGQVLDAAQALLVNADALWRAGPGALSPDLWWWRAGHLVLLPGTPTSLSPPGSFVEVLDALPG